MRVADRLAALLLVAFAGYVMVTAVGLGYWQGRIPGPGFLPLWIGVALALVGLGLLRRRPVDRAPQGLPMPARSELVRVGQVGLITAAGVALVTPLGMIPALTVMLLALVRRMGGSWVGAAGTALLVPAALHLLFVRWLGVPLPRGPLGL